MPPDHSEQMLGVVKAQAVLRCLGCLENAVEIDPCEIGVTVPKMRVSPGEVKDSSGHIVTPRFGVRDQGQHLVKASEPKQRQGMKHAVAGELGVVLPGLDRNRSLPVHRCGKEEHV